MVFLLLFGNAKFDGEGFVAVVIGAVVCTFAVTSFLFGHGEKWREVIFGHFNAHFFKAFLLCFLDVLSPCVKFLHRLDSKRFGTFGDFLWGLDTKKFFVTDDACLGEFVDGAAECLKGGMEGGGRGLDGGIAERRSGGVVGHCLNFGFGVFSPCAKWLFHRKLGGELVEVGFVFRCYGLAFEGLPFCMNLEPKGVNDADKVIDLLGIVGEFAAEGWGDGDGLGGRTAKSRGWSVGGRTANRRGGGG